MFQIYIKKTPISDWQYIGMVKAEQVSGVYARAAAKGYYCKAVEA